MKKWMLSLVGCVVLLAGLIYAATAEKEITTQQIVVTIDGADSSGGFVKGPIHNIRPDNPNVPRFWNVLVGEIYATDFAETDSTIAGESVDDSCIVIVYGGKGRREVELWRDTMAVLPETSFFQYYTKITPSDTSDVGTWIGGTNYQDGLLYDNIWIEYRMADTAGTSGSLSATIYYWFRLYEE